MFKVGDRVISKKYGEGIVEVNCAAFNPRPITVKFDNSEVRQSYTEDGYYWDSWDSKFDTKTIRHIGNDND